MRGDVVCRAARADKIFGEGGKDTLFTASVTFGRYSSEHDAEGDYSGDIEYILSDAIVINSIDEFFQAIENGYSNIQIGDEMDNPLIVSGGISDVRSDLTIDLNGHEIQRNNRQPLLNIREGVTLTIIDSSDEKNGSLYNPVGSVLQLSGGTLTVAAGIFESGPRSGERDASGVRVKTGGNYNEYASGSGQSWSSPSGGSFTSVGDVVLHRRSGNGYVDDGQAELPIITPAAVAGANNNTVNGNMYFDVSSGAAIGVVTEDTYLYYTFEAPNMQFAAVADNGSADYYYEYYVKGGQADGSLSFEYVGATKPTDNDSAILVTVYVYNNVKGSSNGGDDGSPAPDYAAIKMGSGNLYARAGHYYSYFGEAETYCVAATGGYMAVSDGSFNAFGSGVCVECAYAVGSSAEGYREEGLNVTKGTFYSETGDTVRVSGGNMVMTGGSFVKDASKGAQAGDAGAQAGANGSAIDMAGGKLIIYDTVGKGIYFDVTGSFAYGIKASGTGTSLDVHNADINVNGHEQDVPADYESSHAVYTEGGTVRFYGTTNIIVGGSLSTGIYARAGSVSVNGDKFICTIRMSENDGVLSSTAVSTIGGSIDFNVAEAEITSNGLGITIGGGDIDFLSGSTEVNTKRGTGIYVYGGTLELAQGSVCSVTSTIADGTRWAADSSEGEGETDTGVNIYNGVCVESGSLLSYGTLNVTHNGVANATDGLEDDTAYYLHGINSYAVRVEGEQQGGTSEVQISGGTIQNSSGGGIYVSDGEVTLSGTIVQATGCGQYSQYTFNENWTYYASAEGGHAVEVEGGWLGIESGSYTAKQGNGILVRGGDVEISGGTFDGGDVSTSAGAGASYAFKMYGGEIDVTGGTFGAAQTNGGGVFITGTSSQAIANFYGGKIEASGSTGVSVYQNSNVTFGRINNDGTYEGPTVSGQATGLAVEGVNGGTASEINIVYGDFASREASGEDTNKHGVWYGEGATKLTVSGGTFTSVMGSGLYFEVAPAPVGNNVQLSGGVYTGGDPVRHYGYNFIISLYPF